MNEEETFDAWRSSRAERALPEDFVNHLLEARGAERRPLLERSRVAQAALWILAVGVLLLRGAVVLLPFLPR